MDFGTLYRAMQDTEEARMRAQAGEDRGGAWDSFLGSFRSAAETGGKAYLADYYKGKSQKREHEFKVQEDEARLTTEYGMRDKLERAKEEIKSQSEKERRVRALRSLGKIVMANNPTVFTPGGFDASKYTPIDEWLKTERGAAWQDIFGVSLLPGAQAANQFADARQREATAEATERTNRIEAATERQKIKNAIKEQDNKAIEIENQAEILASGLSLEAKQNALQKIIDDAKSSAMDREIARINLLHLEEKWQLEKKYMKAQINFNNANARHIAKGDNLREQDRLVKDSLAYGNQGMNQISDLRYAMSLDNRGKFSPDSAEGMVNIERALADANSNLELGGLPRHMLQKTPDGEWRIEPSQEEVNKFNAFERSLNAAVDQGIPAAGIVSSYWSQAKNLPPKDIQKIYDAVSRGLLKKGALAYYGAFTEGWQKAVETELSRRKTAEQVEMKMRADREWNELGLDTGD